MGARMPHDPQGLGIAFGEEPQRDLAVRSAARSGIDGLAIHLSGNRRLGRPGPISAATSIGRTRSLYSRTLPSGSLTLSMEARREYFDDHRLVTTLPSIELTLIPTREVRDSPEFCERFYTTRQIKHLRYSLSRQLAPTG